MSFNDLFELIKSSKNTLSKITSWRKYDPFEDVVCSVALKNHDNELVHFNKLTEHFYAQCWSLEVESDLMWQVYRKRYEKHGGAVKLQTSLKQLIDSCSEQNFVYLGRVKYLKKPELVGWAKNFRANIENELMFDGGSGKAVAKQLLIKRFPYRFEREVRLLIPDYKSKEENVFPDNYQYNIKSKDFIGKIVFDPLMDMKKFRKSKNNILELNNELRVIRSNLYKLKNDDFQ